MKNLAFVGYKNYAVTKCGKVYSLNVNKFKTIKEYKGYKRVCLSSESKKRWFSVHRLVAMAYIPNPKGLPEVNHIDGDKGNNNLYNLEWVTSQENKVHSIKTGLRELQEFRIDRKLPDSLVHDICTKVEQGYRNIDIANMLGIERHVVKNIKSGTQYKDIVSQYNFTGLTKSKYKMSTSKIDKLCELLSENRSDEDICERMNISKETLNGIKRGDIMPDLISKFMEKAK